MKPLALCLAPLFALVACSVDAPDATATEPPAPSVEPAVRVAPQAGFGPCAPGSQGTCAGQILGTVCGTNPTRFCLPVQGAGNLCRCAAR
jgi:hypothetical protein